MAHVNIDISAVYFIHLYRLGETRYAYDLSGGYNTYSGQLYSFMNGVVAQQYIAVPIPIELAMALNWVDLATVERAFELPLHILAAIKIGATGGYTPD